MFASPVLRSGMTCGSLGVALLLDPNPQCGSAGTTGSDGHSCPPDKEQAACEAQHPIVVGTPAPTSSPKSCPIAVAAVAVDAGDACPVVTLGPLAIAAGGECAGTASLCAPTCCEDYSAGRFRPAADADGGVPLSRRLVSACGCECLAAEAACAALSP